MPILYLPIYLSVNPFITKEVDSLSYSIKGLVSSKMRFTGSSFGSFHSGNLKVIGSVILFKSISSSVGHSSKKYGGKFGPMII